MKKRIIIILIILIIILFGLGYVQLTGKVIGDLEKGGVIGPSSEEQNCILNCMGCSSPGEGCTGNQEQCKIQCNVNVPEMTTEQKCVSDCVKEECEEFDFECQNKNQDKCDIQCGMIKESEAKNEEEQCIRDCVNLHDPDAECSNSQEGETGNSVCQMCAQQCVHLYDGPCLGEEEIREKEAGCKTCEHCYGEPIMGDSGQGWDCIVDIECFDVSSEFGDNPGTGEGIITKTGEIIENIVEGIGNFFKGIFSKEERAEETGLNIESPNDLE